MTLALETLSIRDFRNLSRIDLTVPAGGMVIVGPNGHGKTNLLEAIHYLHILRSVRGARDTELVRFGAEGFHVAARARGGAFDEVRAGFVRGRKRKKVSLDGAECERLADAFGALPSVMFSPRDVELVAGPPTERRRYLDIVLASTSRRYLTALQRYRAALVRRNATLREVQRRGTSDAEGRVAVWEPALAAAGATLWCERVAWSRWAAPRLASLCAAIGERQRVTLEYHSTLAVDHARLGDAAGGDAAGGDARAGDAAAGEARAGEARAGEARAGEARAGEAREGDEAVVREQLAAAFARDRAQDLRRTLTHSGPHRDDLSLKLGGRSLRSFGSAGQQRTCAIALRLLERSTLHERTGRTPLVLLDDPFAELDVERARQILAVLSDGEPGQTFLVVPRADDVPPAYTALARHTILDGVLDA